MSTATQVQLSPHHLGLTKPSGNLDDSIEAANRVLQRNHEEHHIFWRGTAGHNHIAHSILSVFALGGGPTELQRAFDDGAGIQRPPPVKDDYVVQSLSDPDVFLSRVGNLDEYSTFLAYFSKEINEKGLESGLQEFLFSKTVLAEKLFAQLFKGLYHPLIHVGLGLEFAQPSIVAEGLAQAASHDSMGTEDYFLRSEALARTTNKSVRPLVELLRQVHDTESLRTAAQAFTENGYHDGPARVQNGVLSPKNQDLIVDIASQFRVEPSNYERAFAESVNSAAYTTGGAQKPGKARKIDFFHLHALTASLPLGAFLSQSWLSNADKARLMEWKARFDLVWYGASGAVELRLKDIISYRPQSSHGTNWDELCRNTVAVHDDGHLVKLIRALKYGQQISAPFESTDSEVFLVKGEDWFRIAQIAYDSTFDHEIMQKWIWGVGIENHWAHVPSLEVS